MRLGKVLGGCARQHIQGGLCHVRVRMSLRLQCTDPNVSILLSL
jgi:hypothetical protein